MSYPSPEMQDWDQIIFLICKSKCYSCKSSAGGKINLKSSGARVISHFVFSDTAEETGCIHYNLSVWNGASWKMTSCKQSSAPHVRGECSVLALLWFGLIVWKPVRTHCHIFKQLQLCRFFACHVSCLFIAWVLWVDLVVVAKWFGLGKNVKHLPLWMGSST